MLDRYDESVLLAYVEATGGESNDPDQAAYDRAVREQVEQWAAADPALGRLLAELSADRVALRALPDEDPPAGLVDDAMAGITRSLLLGDPIQAADEPAARSFKIHRFLGYSAAAAAVGLCALVLWNVLGPSGLQDTAQDIIASGNGNDNPAEVQPNPLGPGPNPGPDQPGDPRTTGTPDGRWLPPFPEALLAHNNPRDTPGIGTTDTPSPTPDLIPPEPARDWRSNPADPRVVRVVLETDAPATLRTQVVAWANAHDVDPGSLARNAPADETLTLQLPGQAPIDELLDELRGQPDVSLSYVAQAPARRDVYISSGLGDLTGPARMAYAAGVAAAQGQSGSVPVANPGGLGGIVDRAAHHYATGAELGWDLGQPQPTIRADWVADTPAVSRNRDTRLVITIQPSDDARANARLDAGRNAAQGLLDYLR